MVIKQNADSHAMLVQIITLIVYTHYNNICNFYLQIFILFKLSQYEQNKSPEQGAPCLDNAKLCLKKDIMRHWNVDESERGINKTGRISLFIVDIRMENE